MAFISVLFSFFAVILTNHFPPKLFLCFCVSDTVEDESVTLFEVPAELNIYSQRLL